MPTLPTGVPAAATALNTYSDLNALSALKHNPTSPQAIHAVAQQVDALFLQMMLKSMRDAGAAIGADASNEMSMYQDMFDKQISLSLSQHQSLGLGALVTRQWANAAATGSGTAAPAGGSGSGGAMGGVTTGASNTVRAAAGAAGAATAAGADAADASDGADEAQAMAQSPADFVKAVLPAINSAAQALGLSALGVLAQAALETGWGKRMPRAADGSSSLNIFGVKADESWSGSRAAADSVEYVGAAPQVKHAAFRAYGSVADAVSDFATLLQNSPRYRHVVATGGSAQAYVDGIGKSGYATDPQYADKLKEILHSSTFRDAVIQGALAL
jgi:flagellar protein FlgJ